MKQTRHHQSGYVFRKGKNWYVRYREQVLLEDGSTKPAQKCHKLAEATGPYRLKSAANQLAEEFLRPFNDGTYGIGSTMSVNQFIEGIYLPYVEEQRRPSTYHGYRNLWRRYLQPEDLMTLRDFRTFDGEQLLQRIARRGSFSRATLSNIKNFLSGAFKYARRQGILSSPNPMRDVELPKANAANETFAYSLEEETKMFALLPEPAATVVAAAAFTGARKGELRGFLWENYDGSQIKVTISVWRDKLGEPKTRKSKGVIPVIAHLRTRLDHHRMASGNPPSGFIFANPLGKAMNLDALARDVVRPALETAGLKWHGWQAFRRGLATNLDRLGVRDKVIQQILRHANISTTMNIYVKNVSEDAVAAMDALEQKMCATNVQSEPVHLA